MKEKKKVLFVCSANTCRSPVAAAILREYGGDRYDAASAGLFAHNGEPMMPECAEALSILFGHAVDPASHASAGITEEMIRGSDIIVAVSKGYEVLLTSYFPEASGRIVSFPEAIADISRFSGEMMLQAVKQIRNGVFDMFLNDEDPS